MAVVNLTCSGGLEPLLFLATTEALQGGETGWEGDVESKSDMKSTAVGIPPHKKNGCPSHRGMANRAAAAARYRPRSLPHLTLQMLTAPYVYLVLGFRPEMVMRTLFLPTSTLDSVLATLARVTR